MAVIELGELALASIRDGFVQVSAFVAATVLLFGLVQYWTDGALVRHIEDNERLQPLFGAVLGLTPGCGGAIVVMPLYVRGTVSFGTVVATLAATAGDSAFVLLALAPEAALYAYGITFVAALATGYLVDEFGMGVSRVDAAVARFSPKATDGGGVVSENPVTRPGPTSNPGHEYGGASGTESSGAGSSSATGRSVCCGPAESAEFTESTGFGDAGVSADSVGCEATRPVRRSSLLTPLSHVAHVVWWVAAVAAFAIGVVFLVRGGPDVSLTLAPTFDGAFTVVGIVGATLSVYLYAVGRYYLGDGEVARARDSFASMYDTLTHAALETSFVTVWVLGAFLAYEALVLGGLDIAAVAAAAGVLAPVTGAALGIIPGCGPQIVLATVYAEGSLPFSALVANAISQDGDALFPLLAIDKRAAVIATVYNFVPAVIVGVLLWLVWGPVLGLPEFGFGIR